VNGWRRPLAAHVRSFLVTIEKELIYRQNPEGRNVSRLAIFDLIERFSNPRWRHSTLGEGAARLSNRGQAPTAPRSLQRRRD
jgi:hypothetical protein